MTETVHTTREIEALIPHRWPILLVDRIVEYDADAKRIVGIKGVTASEWYFQGHFPGLPVMPGVIQVEALAQTMAVYVAKQPGYGDRIGLFAGIDDCRFKRVVSPGDTLRLEVTMEKLGGRFGRGHGVASVDGENGLRRDALVHHPERGGAAMTRVIVLSDVHGNALALAAVRKAIRTEKPDLVAVAGDLALNGPDPAGTIDLLREMEADGAAIINGNTDVAVADFDYSAAVGVSPGMGDTRPGDPAGGRRMGTRRARRRAAGLAPPPAVGAPASRRGRDDDPGLPRLAGLADRRVRPAARPERRHRAGRTDRCPDHRLWTHPHPGGARPRLEDDRERRLGRLRVRR